MYRVDEKEFVYLDWRWLLLIGIVFSFLLLWSMFVLGLKITLALFLGAILFFCAVFSPEIPLLVWTLLIINEPFMTGTFNFGSGINLTNIFLALIVMGWMLGSAVRREDFIRPSPINIPILVILIFAVISFIRGASFFGYSLVGDELNSFKRYITFYIVMLLSMNSFSLRRPIYIIALFGVMILGLLYEIRVTFSQHSAVASWHYSHKMRIPGSFEGGGGANELGTYYAQGLPFVFALALEHPYLPLRLFSLLLVLLGIHALFMTYSRGAYLSCFLGLGGMSWIKDRRVFALLVLLGVLSYPLWPVSVRERLTSITHEDASVRGRKNVWRIARQKIVASPILGYGYNASAFLLPRDTHNMYYDIALEMGLPSLIAVVYLFIRLLFIAYRVWRKADVWFLRALALGLVGSILALLLGNMFGTRLAYLPINMYLAVSAGIVARASYEYAKG